MMSAPCPVFGFVVHFERPPDESVAHALVEMLEGNGLVAGRRGDREYVVTREGMQATDADRSIVREWAAGRAAGVSIGELADISEGR